MEGGGGWGCVDVILYFYGQSCVYAAFANSL